MSERYPDIFDNLKNRVREAGLLDRVPVRGSIEMILIAISTIAVLATMQMWNPILMGLALTVIFTRSVFVSHDILHSQYFKNRTLSRRLSYPFSNFLICNSSSWWNKKHNINHHTYCNVVEKDEDIQAMDGAFAPQIKGNSPFIRSYKYFIFWGGLFLMYPAFIKISFEYVIKHRLYNELSIMVLHFIVIWGSIFYFLPLTSAITVFVTLYLTLSIWLSLGFITNHLGCETFTAQESKDFSWMELQMRTSRSLKGKAFMHWFYGGLDTQIEHHLFPKAPRFHLLKVKKITMEFAKENNIPYFETTPLLAYKQINDVIGKY